MSDEPVWEDATHSHPLMPDDEQEPGQGDLQDEALDQRLPSLNEDTPGSRRSDGRRHIRAANRLRPRGYGSGFRQQEGEVRQRKASNRGPSRLWARATANRKATVSDSGETKRRTGRDSQIGVSAGWCCDGKCRKHGRQKFAGRVP